LEVASLADLVEQAAGRDDAVSIAILEEAARELARTVAWSIQTRRFCFSTGNYWRNNFAWTTLRLHSSAPVKTWIGVTEIRHVPEPAEGAVQLAWSYH